MSKIRDFTTSYNQKNIVGPVSQSGGIPTGAIIERGSNANGGYTKYADGTLICIYNNNNNSNIPGGTTVAVSGITGMFKSSDVVFTFAMAFIATPVVSLGACRGSYDNNEIWGQIRNITTTTVTARMMSNFNSSALGMSFNFIAIGRWY